MTSLRLSVLGLVVLVSCVDAAAVEDGLAPFEAELTVASTYVRSRADESSPEVGLLREGARVRVTACQPDCTQEGAWALLGTDGAVRASMLRRVDPSIAARASDPGPEALIYGRVGKRGITIYTSASARSRVLSRRRIPREMAFFPDEPLRASGWLHRVDGGYVRAGHVELLVPSTFAGTHDPQLPLAFVVRPPRSSGLTRYQTLGVDALGTLPRHAVRIVSARARPAEIPAGARWVDVDLHQQTLTAYEGDHPVFATLMSSGHGARRDWTHPGLYRVQHKLLYSDMHGERGEPYDVDRVPYSLYFNANEALHGTYWHDKFGAPTSHGCVNLSLADARWLFSWAPPALPDQWSAVAVTSDHPDALYVYIR
ncbi:MAG: L,D-transpeptidase [Polyangia bacterium]